MTSLLEPIAHSVKWDEPIDALVRMRARERTRRRRFIEAVREGEKSEFIYGEVVVHSPVTLRHNQMSGRLITMLRAYVMRRGAGVVGHENLMISLSRNDYEPDVCWFGRDKAVRLEPEQRRCPAPDFVAEVLSASTAGNDRGVKRTDYAAHGITEYWIIDPEAEAVEQYVLDGDSYPDARPIRTGEIVSTAIAGFGVPVRAIFDDVACSAAMAAIYSSA